MSEPSGSVWRRLGSRRTVRGPWALAWNVELGRVTPGLERPVEVAADPVADVGHRDANGRSRRPTALLEPIAGRDRNDATGRRARRRRRRSTSTGSRPSSWRTMKTMLCRSPSAISLRQEMRSLKRPMAVPACRRRAWKSSSPSTPAGNSNPWTGSIRSKNISVAAVCRRMARYSAIARQRVAGAVAGLPDGAVQIFGDMVDEAGPPLALTSGAVRRHTSARAPAIGRPNASVPGDRVGRSRASRSSMPARIRSGSATRAVSRRSSRAKIAVNQSVARARSAAVADGWARDIRLAKRAAAKAACAPGRSSRPWRVAQCSALRWTSSACGEIRGTSGQKTARRGRR